MPTDIEISRAATLHFPCYTGGGGNTAWGCNGDRRGIPMDDDTLYIRAIAIQDRRERGLWLPIMRHLMLRGHDGAMLVLGHWYTELNGPRDLDGIGGPYTAANLYYRVWRKGGADAARAAHSLALCYFNRGDMLRFRYWARRGARSGDYSCKFYVKHFETRLPHANARDVRRKRPEARRDAFA